MYERIITLDEDIELVWRRRWSGVTVLYGALHLSVVALLMTTLAGYFVVSCAVSPPVQATPPVTHNHTEVSDGCYHIRPLTPSLQARLTRNSPSNLALYIALYTFDSVMLLSIGGKG